MPGTLHTTAPSAISVLEDIEAIGTITIKGNVIVHSGKTVAASTIKFITFDDFGHYEPKVTLQHGAGIHVLSIELNGEVKSIGEMEDLGYLVFEA